MKTIFLSACMLLFGYGINAQKSDSTAYKYELHVNLKPVLNLVLNAPAADNPMQLMLKRKNKIGAYRISGWRNGQYDYLGNYGINIIPFPVATDINRHYSFSTKFYGLSVGFERRHQKNYGGWYYGNDILASYATSTLAHHDFLTDNTGASIFMDEQTDAETNYNILGANSFIGIYYNINKRLTASAEIQAVYTYEFGDQILIDKEYNFSTQHITSINFNQQALLSVAYSFAK